MKKANYTTPEGYFDELEGKVFRRIGTERRRGAGHVLSYVAIAATFAAMVVLGNFFLRSITPSDSQDSAVELLAYQTTEQDVVEYLIWTGEDIDEVE